MRPVILYRGVEFEDYELAAAQRAGFFCTKSRMHIKAADLVVGRYSCLPNYRELEYDIEYSGARLLNSYNQHLFIADMINWYECLGPDLTPRTWFSAQDIPPEEDGPFFVKGECNSKKFEWDTHAFAKDRAALGRVATNLMADTLISSQRLCIRKFEPLVTYGIGIRNMPITKEYRAFCAYGEILSIGYYWSSHVEDLEFYGVDKGKVLDTSDVPREFINQVLDEIGDQTTGVVIDIGQKVSGEWTVIELNDLQQSGLSENNPDDLYSNLMAAITKNVI